MFSHTEILTSLCRFPRSVKSHTDSPDVSAWQHLWHSQDKIHKGSKVHVNFEAPDVSRCRVFVEFMAVENITRFKTQTLNPTLPKPNCLPLKTSGLENILVKRARCLFVRFLYEGT